MIEIMRESRGAVVGVHVTGHLRKIDYETFLPILEARFREHGRLRVLFYADEGFRGWDLQAAWDDMALGLRHASDFERLALVGAPAWVNLCLQLSAFLMKGETRVFARDDLDAAWAWIRGEGEAVTAGG